MFEAIRSHGEGPGPGVASYWNEEVQGHVSFATSVDRTCVISSIGPDEAILCCTLSHYFAKFRNGYRARVSAEVDSLA